MIFVSKRLPLSTESLLNWYLEASIQTTFITSELVPLSMQQWSLHAPFGTRAEPYLHNAVTISTLDRCRDVDCNRDPTRAAFCRGYPHRHTVVWFMGDAYLSRRLLRRVVARSSV